MLRPKFPHGKFHSWKPVSIAEVLWGSRLCEFFYWFITLWKFPENTLWKYHFLVRLKQILGKQPRWKPLTSPRISQPPTPQGARQKTHVSAGGSCNFKSSRKERKLFRKQTRVRMCLGAAAAAAAAESLQQSIRAKFICTSLSCSRFSIFHCFPTFQWTLPCLTTSITRSPFPVFFFFSSNWIFSF